jgi:hypothetical protein
MSEQEAAMQGYSVRRVRLEVVEDGVLRPGHLMMLAGPSKAFEEKSE